jgi:hypothetical protein
MRGKCNVHDVAARLYALASRRCFQTALNVHLTSSRIACPANRRS